MDLCDRRHLSGPANCPAGITSMDGFATGSRRAGPRNLLDQLRLGRNDVLPSGASKLAAATRRPRQFARLSRFGSPSPFTGRGLGEGWCSSTLDPPLVLVLVLRPRSVQANITSSDRKMAERNIPRIFSISGGANSSKPPPT